MSAIVEYKLSFNTFYLVWEMFAGLKPAYIAFKHCQNCLKHDDPSSSARDLLICRVCLCTNVKMYNINQYQLKSYYDEVLAITSCERDGLPQYFCFECAHMLQKFHNFKEKCSIGRNVLTDLLYKGPINYNSIQNIDIVQLKLKSSLQIENALEEKVTVKEEPVCNQSITKIENIEVDNDLFSDQDDPDIDPVDTELEASLYDLKDSHESTPIYKRDGKIYNRNGIMTHKISLDENYWKKYEMSEEEALQHFKIRSENEKYIAAPYKCLDCFKGFSKENILKRHLILRHNDTYKVECPFCCMRFKLNCFMQKHLKSHYTKYECLRCNIIYPLESSALFHEEFHSGVIRTCKHCNEEFRHSSTYYSHMRTHKSEFVCSVCGSSFVSEAGLHQHKRIKHCDSVDSPDDEDMNTFCSKCNINFENRKAYEEHLFHSIKHIEESENENEASSLDKRRKSLGKRMKEKISGQLSKKSRNVTAKSERKCKRRRQPRKPTTCHQCDKHFETQAACMKHHLSAHPRTSFCAPNQRHICEICGASLAPGSVIAHQNMHTRERVHPCETCGKQFYTTISLKRHLVTHTGEKPFPCSLCDKRFTQSNSMKLHYRTFHLKQPYPKRNRRKKNVDMNGSMDAESQSEDSSDMSKTKKKIIEPEIEPSAVTVEVINETNGLFNFCG